MNKAPEKIKINWPFIGNDNIIKYFTKSIANDNVSSFYLFLGPKNLGKTTLAIHLSKILLCQGNMKTNNAMPCEVCDSCHKLNLYKNKTENDGFDIPHGDFHIIKKEKDKKNISIEQVRDFVNKINLSSFLGGYKIGIIKNAESLSKEASNALLKTLEEPKGKVMIIMITDNEEYLPKTIISRSQVVRFRPVNKDIIYDHLISDFKASRSQARKLSRLSLGKPVMSVKYFEDKDYYNQYLDEVRLFLNIVNSNDINERLEIVDDSIGKNISGQESVEKIKLLLNIWQGVIRDLLLLNFDLADLIQHNIIEEEIYKLKESFNPSRVLRVYNIFQKGKVYLNANVNPKFVIEGVVINI
jgi:DNA polymerase-3 subunit delta'